MRGGTALDELECNFRQKTVIVSALLCFLCESQPNNEMAAKGSGKTRERWMKIVHFTHLRRSCLLLKHLPLHTQGDGCHKYIFKTVTKGSVILVCMLSPILGFSLANNTGLCFTDKYAL